MGAPDANGVRVGVMTNTHYCYWPSPPAAGRCVPSRPAAPARRRPSPRFSSIPTHPWRRHLGRVGPDPGPQRPDCHPDLSGQHGHYPGRCTTGTLTSTGWGYRTEPGGSGSITTPTTGGMTGTVTQTAGGTFGSGADPFNYTMAAVVSGSPATGLLTAAVSGHPSPARPRG